MSSALFADRADAGRQLVAPLEDIGAHGCLLLGVPRGGVPVAAAAAPALAAEVDVVVVRKVGAPHNPELGLGAVGPDGRPVLDETLVRQLGVSETYLNAAVERERLEAVRRVEVFRGDRAPADIAERDVVVVDDGIATGGTVTAAAALIRARQPRRLILAVPVAPSEAIPGLRRAYDEIVCLATPQPFLAVGPWYGDFHQITDDEVRSTLESAGSGVSGGLG